MRTEHKEKWMKTNKDAMDAVLRGVKEVIDPAFTYKGHTEEWVYYIDTATLDMFDDSNCLLAQLAPVLLPEEAEKGMLWPPLAEVSAWLVSKRDFDDLVPWHATDFGGRLSWTQYFGFDAWSTVYTYGDLTEAWTYYIEGRRDQAA
jgi:hypothetical protein